MTTFQNLARNRGSLDALSPETLVSLIDDKIADLVDRDLMEVAELEQNNGRRILKNVATDLKDGKYV